MESYLGVGFEVAQGSPLPLIVVGCILLREVQSMLSGLGHTLQRLLLMALGVPD